MRKSAIEPHALAPDEPGAVLRLGSYHNLGSERPGANLQLCTVQQLERALNEELLPLAPKTRSRIEANLTANRQGDVSDLSRVERSHDSCAAPGQSGRPSRAFEEREGFGRLSTHLRAEFA